MDVLKCGAEGREECRRRYIKLAETYSTPGAWQKQDGSDGRKGCSITHSGSALAITAVSQTSQHCFIHSVCLNLYHVEHLKAPLFYQTSPYIGS